MLSSNHAILVLSACLSSLISNVVSFTPAITHNIASPSAPLAIHNGVITTTNRFSQSRTSLFMAGFGAASSSKKKKGGSLPKLKAKSQWDRYQDMKKSEKVTVGVRIQGTDEWMEVGRVRSADDDITTEVAIARQRALIAEHSKRLYPVQIPANAVLEWGRLEGEEWTVVDKSKGDDAPKGIEKKIGFEGISDKATGFYCYYHEGRIVEKEEEGMGTRGSGFAAIKGK